MLEEEEEPLDQHNSLFQGSAREKYIDLIDDTKAISVQAKNLMKFMGSIDRVMLFNMVRKTPNYLGGIIAQIVKQDKRTFSIQAF